MRIGALLGPILDASKANYLADQAVQFVDAGIQSLWSAQAIGRGFFITDPFVALATAAGALQTRGADAGIEFGTAIVQVPLYHPMDLAHRVFSLQQICGNQLLLGIGAGSTDADFSAYDSSYEQRFDAFETKAKILKDIFATGGVDAAQLSPWPALEGGPPLFLGSWGKGVADAAQNFDGWIASGLHRNTAQVCEAIKGYRAAGGNRAIVSTLQIGSDTDLAEFVDKLEHFRDAGFDDAVIMIMPGGPSIETVGRQLNLLRR